MLANYSTPAPPIIRLPIELACNIIQLLDIDDAFILGSSCRFFRNIMRDSSICRPLIEKYAPFSDECVRYRPTWNYATALSAVAKRHAAIANLEPFAVAVVAEADDPTYGARRDNGGNNGYSRNYAPPPPAYVYASQALLYMVGRTLRILPLHGGSTIRSEMVVDVRMLLDEAIPESDGTRNYLFRPIHYSDGIVSCVYAHHRVAGGHQESWLVLLNPETSWCTSHRLALPHHRLFVRNNKDFLVFGTYTNRRVPEQDSEIAGLGGGEGANNDTTAAAPASAGPAHHGRHRRWVLRHYSFLTDTWSAKAIFLDNAIGLADLGSSLCFDVIDGYFYALANQQRYLEDGEYDYDDDEYNYGANGQYTSNIGFSSADPMGLTSMHQYPGGPRPPPAGLFATSSYYTCVRFPLSNPHRREIPTWASLWRRRNDEGAVDDRWTTLQLEKSQATGQIFAVESRKEWLRASGGSSSRRTYYMQPLEWILSDSKESDSSIQGENTSNINDTSSSAAQLQRLPENVHPGDDAARVMPLTLNKCAARVYSMSSRTFMDLYYQNASWSANGQTTPQLVLRAGARRFRPPTLVETHSSGETANAYASGRDGFEGGNQEDGSDNLLYPMREISKHYVDKDVVTWPAVPDGNNDKIERSRELNEILNPPGYGGNITGTSWDDRLLIYSTNSNIDNTIAEDNGKQAIVIISFDPTLLVRT
ncbi:hypothetical protein SEUCBS139899_005305 [Sporothrix eucalyptigena]